MIQLVAPYASAESVVTLPNPEFDNSDALTSSLNVIQTNDGTLFVYKKTKAHQNLDYPLSLTPAKAEELKAFLDFYVGQYIRVTDVTGGVWRVLLSNESFEFETSSADNWTKVHLSFQGVRVNA